MPVKKTTPKKARELAEKISDDSVTRMMALFEGFKSVSGTHGVPDRDGLKWSIKSTARTGKTTVTEILWRQHLEGLRPLGVVPIREDSMCLWGSIDIDKYNINLLDVVKRVESLGFPLVPCRSKSGGLHLFLFALGPVPAAVMQVTLRNLAAALGFSDSEIFPKQTKVLSEKGDMGNWMVMPYFGGDFDGKLKMQHGLKKTGAEQTLEEFLAFAEKQRIGEEQMIELRQRNEEGESPSTAKGKKASAGDAAKKPKKPFTDGPPCLQFLAEGNGFPEGGRNNALFHIGVYLKKAHPTNWKDKLEEDNQKFMRPPLKSKEIDGIIASLENKEYQYKCKDQPMVSHCDSILCRTRRHGVGADAYPEIRSMRRFDTEPPVWFADITGKNGAITVRMQTDDLMNFYRFQKICLEAANIMHQTISQNLWSSIVADAIDTHLEIIPAPPDLGIGGMFLELLETFLTNRTKGNTRDDILRGAPWEDDENGRHYFRMQDLQKFLRREDMKMSRSEVSFQLRRVAAIQEIKARPKRKSDAVDEKEISELIHDESDLCKAFIKIKGNGVNVWWVPSNAINRASDLDPPDMPEEKL